MAFPNKVPEILRVTGLPKDVGNVIGACLPPSESGGVDEAVKAIWQERLESMERQPKSTILRRHLAMHPKKPAEAYKAAIEELSEKNTFSLNLEEMHFERLNGVEESYQHLRNQHLDWFFKKNRSILAINNKYEEITRKYGCNLWQQSSLQATQRANAWREWLNQDPNPVAAIAYLPDIDEEMNYLRFNNPPPEIIKFTGLELPYLAGFLKGAAEQGYRDAVTAILECPRSEDFSPDQLGEAFLAAAKSLHPRTMKLFFALPRFEEIPAKYLQKALVEAIFWTKLRPLRQEILLSHPLPEEAFDDRVLNLVCWEQPSLIVPFMKQAGFREALKKKATPWVSYAAVAAAVYLGYRKIF